MEIVIVVIVGVVCVWYHFASGNGISISAEDPQSTLMIAFIKPFPSVVINILELRQLP